MTCKTLFRTLSLAGITAAFVASSSIGVDPVDSPAPAAPVADASYILTGPGVAAITAAVTSAGGEITHELAIIQSVGAYLNAEQLARVQSEFPAMTVYPNIVAETTGRKTRLADEEVPTSDVAGDAYTHYPSLIGADLLHQEGITGAGVGVAVLDTGIYTGPGLSGNTAGKYRIMAAYDAILNQAQVGPYNKRRGYSGFEEFDNDDSGHGSHISSAGFGSKLASNGKYNGVAPDVKLISVKVFDADGRGTYADVIRGVQWAVDNRATYNIRVLNMSLSATPQSHYWDDPLNRAVMAAWHAGVVVVASAGNTGPKAQSIGVPGNVPYIITVGAMTDNNTPSDGSDDYLASFSAAGPTFEGFVKPEVVAPGGHIMAAMQDDSRIALDYPQYHDGASFFSMSGTSQATALVSGIAALILQAEPALTPDQVKCKIMTGARPALDVSGNLAYSIFQQGAGLANAYDAVYAQNYDCANNGLDIQADLDGTKHFGGRANENEVGEFYLMGMDGYIWSSDYISNNGYLWSDGYLWSNGYLWSSGYLWTDGRADANGYLWSDGYLWSSGYLWSDSTLRSSGYLWRSSLTETMSINTWVDQE